MLSYILCLECGVFLHQFMTEVNNHSIEIPPLLIEKAVFGHSQHGVLRQSDCYANLADERYQQFLHRVGSYTTDSDKPRHNGQMFP